jgi:hypothetical protein
MGRRAIATETAAPPEIAGNFTALIPVCDSGVTEPGPGGAATWTDIILKRRRMHEKKAQYLSGGEAISC